MNNLQTYNEFLNEELNWKDVKRFGRGVLIKHHYIKNKAILNILKFLFGWNKEIRGTLNNLKIFIDRTKVVCRILNLHDLTLKSFDKTPEDQLVPLIKHVAEEYENKYGQSFVEDLKTLAQTALKSQGQILKSEKKQKAMNQLRKMISILSDGDGGGHEQEDPFEEEEWEDANEFNIMREIIAGARMTNKQFVDNLKRQLVGKTILMTPDIGSADKYFLAYKEKFRIADIILKDENNKQSGVILIDDKGKWHEPSKNNKIQIKD
jgi:hypothetical protein